MPRFHYTQDFASIQPLELEPQEINLLHKVREQVAVRLSDLLPSVPEATLHRLLEHHHLNLIPTPLCPTVVLGKSARVQLSLPGQMIHPTKACDLVYQREGLSLLQQQGYKAGKLEGPHRWVISPFPKPRQSLMIAKFSGGGYAALTLRKTIHVYRSTLAQLGGQFIVLHPRPHRLYLLADDEPSLTVFHFDGRPEPAQLP